MPDSFITTKMKLLFARSRVNGSASTIGACVIRTNLLVPVRQGGNAVHEVTDARAAQQLEKCRYLCHHVHDIACETARANSIGAASGDDGHFVHLAQWLGAGAHDLRHTRPPLIQDSRLVIFVESCGFDLSRLGFRFTPGTDSPPFRHTSSA